MREFYVSLIEFLFDDDYDAIFSVWMMWVSHLDWICPEIILPDSFIALPFILRNRTICILVECIFYGR